MACLGVIGAGYVGLTTAVCLAKLGHEVVVSDVNSGRIDLLNQGISPIVEDGLEELLRAGISSRNLRFTLVNLEAVKGSEFVFICLPTPQGENGVADTSYVESAAGEIASSLESGSIVITKSTVPVGSTKVIEAALNRKDVDVVSNPEFLREGSAIHDFLNPDRIVVGSSNNQASQRVAEIYGSLDAPCVITDPASAETIKYAANAFLATKISYINAIAALCEGVGADVLAVIEGIGLDKRIGSAFLQPGPGWGGSCFPKDSKALVKIAENAGYDFALLRGVIEVNEQQYLRIVEKIMSTQKDHLSEFRVTVLGLTFKAGTDDRRDSPALFIARLLQKRGAVVNAYDPTVKADNNSSDLIGIQLFDSAYDALTGSDVLAVLTEWEEIRGIEPVQVSNLMRSKVVVDARNVLNKETWQSNGFNYLGVGR